ncbi:hypothetical protein COCC4DRAFT_147828 [Bipolaris maydis ATCC 48331]|uniref:Uncharacterized protein n=2 Tax=Cochliobolus heterostrophus TaxID=5016 RepID=M2V3S0_COCH5|nr:uncharacterized protein COCC4DRAFT_147828 [Bipolaris maydis ATCC 48331]EMD94668.1 hypothetical protein COCHEDRAFT_1201237 [Bipolaris maydis C5]ENI01620.1 hypothetical protein COCC4DRAFT_147828 [Bipolaris maydis ATCC 48331]
MAVPLNAEWLGFHHHPRGYTHKSICPTSRPITCALFDFVLSGSVDGPPVFLVTFLLVALAGLKRWLVALRPHASSVNGVVRGRLASGLLADKLPRFVEYSNPPTRGATVHASWPIKCFNRTLRDGKLVTGPGTYYTNQTPQSHSAQRNPVQ